MCLQHPLWHHAPLSRESEGLVSSGETQDIPWGSCRSGELQKSQAEGEHPFLHPALEEAWRQSALLVSQLLYS